MIILFVSSVLRYTHSRAYRRMLPSTIHCDAQLLLQYDAAQRRFGEMENLMKSIEQELNHVFHTIGSENGA